MQSIDNYINERLNPKHLGNIVKLKEGQVCDLGDISWSIDAQNASQTSLETSLWYCGVVNEKDVYTQHKILVFWSPNCEYIINVSHYSVTYDNPANYAWCVIKCASTPDQDPNKFYKSIYKNKFIDYIKANKDYELLEPKIEYDKTVADVLEQFKKMPKA